MSQKSEENLARIELEHRTHNIKRITMNINGLRFRCKRCAIFCCKLGAPSSSENDVNLLGQLAMHEKFGRNAPNDVKNPKNGQCQYLSFDNKRAIYECQVYAGRPLLCRLFPLHFEKEISGLIKARIMPCLGINRRQGELIDATFVATNFTMFLKEMAEKLAANSRWGEPKKQRVAECGKA